MILEAEKKQEDITKTQETVRAEIPESKEDKTHLEHDLNDDKTVENDLKEETAKPSEDEPVKGSESHMGLNEDENEGQADDKPDLRPTETLSEGW